MSRYSEVIGTWVHDDLSQHLKVCSTCHAVDPEKSRLLSKQLGGQWGTVAAALSALCPIGREVYRQYLRWLTEPK
jgi:hypothetical protein